MRKLLDGRCRIVVTTEMGARGLDIPGLTHVVNLELPTGARPHARDSATTHTTALPRARGGALPQNDSTRNDSPPWRRVSARLPDCTPHAHVQRCSCGRAARSTDRSASNLAPMQTPRTTCTARAAAGARAWKAPCSQSCRPARPLSSPSLPRSSASSSSTWPSRVASSRSMKPAAAAVAAVAAVAAEVAVADGAHGGVAGAAQAVAGESGLQQGRADRRPPERE